MINIREYFLEAIAEAKSPPEYRNVILHSCSIPYEWFNGKKPRYKDLEESVMQMTESQLKIELAIFIANCYRQR